MRLSLRTFITMKWPRPNACLLSKGVTWNYLLTFVFSVTVSQKTHVHLQNSQRLILNYFLSLIMNLWSVLPKSWFFRQIRGFPVEFDIFCGCYKIKWKEVKFWQSSIFNENIDYINDLEKIKSEKSWKLYFWWSFKVLNFKIFEKF